MLAEERLSPDKGRCPKDRGVPDSNFLRCPKDRGVPSCHLDEEPSVISTSEARRNLIQLDLSLPDSK